jgi:hypothetical protein
MEKLSNLYFGHGDAVDEMSVKMMGSLCIGLAKVPTVSLKKNRFFFIR